MPIQSYRDLLVWQKSLRLADDVERLAARLPVEQRYCLASQLRRASTSIPFNIGEGWAQPTKVYIHHLLIALGSEAELQTELRHAASLAGVLKPRFASCLTAPAKSDACCADWSEA